MSKGGQPCQFQMVQFRCESVFALPCGLQHQTHNAFWTAFWIHFLFWWNPDLHFRTPVLAICPLAYTLSTCPPSQGQWTLHTQPPNQPRSSFCTNNIHHNSKSAQRHMRGYLLASTKVLPFQTTWDFFSGERCQLDGSGRVTTPPSGLC